MFYRNLDVHRVHLQKSAKKKKKGMQSIHFIFKKSFQFWAQTANTKRRLILFPKLSKLMFINEIQVSNLTNKEEDFQDLLNSSNQHLSLSASLFKIQTTSISICYQQERPFQVTPPFLGNAPFTCTVGGQCVVKLIVFSLSYFSMWKLSSKLF